MIAAELAAVARDHRPSGAGSLPHAERDLAGRHALGGVASAGDAAVIQDVATGAVERRIATGERVKHGALAAGGDAAGHLALVFGEYR